MSIWDDPNLQPEDGDFVRLDAAGDTIGGVITGLATQRWDDGSTSPQIRYTDARTGTPKVWTAGQTQAKRQLAELRPEVGDSFTATLTQVEKRSGGKTLKHITVTVERAGAAPQTPADPWGTAAPAAVNIGPAPAGVDEAAWAAMTPERRAQISAALGAPAAAEPPF